MPSFLSGTALFAGLVGALALGPIVIHLLNRRRFRVISWAAMDFLREALQRNRRIMQLRDVLLLALRTLVILLLGAALARPFIPQGTENQWLLLLGFGLAGFLAVLGAIGFPAGSARKASGGAAALCLGVAAITLATLFWGSRQDEIIASDASQPVHAVLVVDNSLSMAYSDAVGSTLLQQAQQKAKEFVDQLPEKSLVSVIPLCGADEGISFDPFRTKQQAQEAIDKIAPVDRSALVTQALSLAQRAAERDVTLPKRIVILSDQQAENWRMGALDADLARLSEVQFVSLAPKEPENVWISQFKTAEGISDTELATHFLARVEYQGGDRPADLQVVLSVNGVEVDSKTIELQPGQDREVEFDYVMDVAVDEGHSAFVPAKVALRVASGSDGAATAVDRLAEDNERFLAVPVVASLPVLFVDQYGEDENPHENRIGETYNLRRLLAPITSRDSGEKQLVKVRQARIDEVNRDKLKDVRLVVIAGVERPPANPQVLRDLTEFVRQGGQLVIAAGDLFDPAAWNEAAWLRGDGLLPAPLASELVGRRLGEAIGTGDYFQLSFPSLESDYFLLPGVERQELQDLYAQPYFFRAVSAQLDDKVRDELIQAETERLRGDRQFLADADEREKQWSQKEARGELTQADTAARAEDQARRERINPTWLLWAPASPIDDRSESLDAAARRTEPLVLARYTNELPFLIERKLGRGRTLLFTSGVYASPDGDINWNTLARMDAVILYDHILRSLLEQTLPQRNFQSVGEAVVPIEPQMSKLSYTLTRPDGESEPLAVDALGEDRYGLTVRNISSRGIYQLDAERPSESGDSAGETNKIWHTPLAVNGAADESDLRSIDPEGFQERVGDSPNVRLVAADETISLAGAQVFGAPLGVELWKWLLGAVLLLLVVEMSILAWPTWIKNREKKRMATV